FQIEVLSNGYGLKDDDVAKSVQAMREIVTKVGAVAEKTRDENGVKVYGFTTTDKTNATLRVEARIDAMRGFSMTATTVTTTATAAQGDEFLANAHMRQAPDPLKDPATLEGVRIRKAGKNFVAHDKADLFTIELPWMATVERKFIPEKFHVN